MRRFFFSSHWTALFKLWYFFFINIVIIFYAHFLRWFIFQYKKKSMILWICPSFQLRYNFIIEKKIKLSQFWIKKEEGGRKGFTILSFYDVFLLRKNYRSFVISFVMNDITYVSLKNEWKASNDLSTVLLIPKVSDVLVKNKLRSLRFSREVHT